VAGISGRFTHHTTTEYEFAVDGQTHRFESSLPGIDREYPGPAEIVYLPENPTEEASRKYLNRPVTEIKGFSFTLMGVVFFVAMTPLWMLMLSPTLRRRRLLISGLPVRGTVMLAKNTGTFWLVNYEFTVAGAPQIGVSRISTKYEKEIPIGASVLILYDPRKPKRSDLYLPAAKSFEIVASGGPS
jgi:hypothetical protein